MNSLAERLDEVRHRIADAAHLCGREPSSIELIVVTKNHPAELVLKLLELGVRNFGENRDQEAAPKAREVAEAFPITTPIWHFVGQLQSNKVKSVLSYASVLHSLDRMSLLKELDKQLLNHERKLDCFIQLNLTSNAERGGVNIDNLQDFAGAAGECRGLRILGLMAVADPARSASSEFERVVAARDQLTKVIPEARSLSIGMSGDFEEAIALGATHLRIGSAITASSKALA